MTITTISRLFLREGRVFFFRRKCYNNQTLKYGFQLNFWTFTTCEEAMNPTKLTIRRPDDFHVHLRELKMLLAVIRFTASVFGRAIIMPNLQEAVTTPKQLKAYYTAIKEAVMQYNLDFEPLMTFKIMPWMTPEHIDALADAGAVAGKGYPKDLTTNAEDGLSRRDFWNLSPALGAMARRRVRYLQHCEWPDDRSRGDAGKVWTMERENACIPFMEWVVQEHPDLDVVVEHVTTQEMADFVENGPSNLAATITAHHMKIDGNDTFEPKTKVHLCCKPYAKRPSDRRALVQKAISGNPKFFLGSDSAPHPVGAKVAEEVACGVFSAPVLMPTLAEIFEQHDALDKLEDFTSRFGAEFYGLPLNEGTITLVRKPWQVPDIYGDAVPFRAGETLAWEVETA